MSRQNEISAERSGASAPFDYVVGLHLLISAVGIGKVLDGTGTILEHRDRSEVCPAHLLATLLVGCLLLQNAWASFANRRIIVWKMSTFLLVCSTPFLYVLMANLLFPEAVRQSGDFAGVYGANVRWITGLAVLAQVTSTWMVHKVEGPSRQRKIQDGVRMGAGMILTVLWCFPYSEHKILHGISLGVLCLALVGYILTDKQEFDLTVQSDGAESQSGRSHR